MDRIGTLEACGNAGNIGKRSGLKMCVFRWVGYWKVGAMGAMGRMLGGGWWVLWVGCWVVGGMIGPNEVCFTLLMVMTTPGPLSLTPDTNQ